MMPAATSGMTWGRNRTVRDTVPSRPVATRRMTRRDEQPEDDRDDAEEDDELERVDDGPEQVGIGEDR